jgi:hypothetical protein
MGYQCIFIADQCVEMMKEDALIKAMVDAIVAPSDTESEEATKLALEISRNMKIGEVLECQRKAVDMVAKLTEEPTTIH